MTHKRGITSGKNVDPSRSSLRASGRSRSPHRPYPAHYETAIPCEAGRLITIRPIKPEDSELHVNFFNSLSERTVFLRFLRNLKSLPQDWVVHFTSIDYERDVAMIAVETTECGEKILGVCRIMRPPKSDAGEIAVVVADAWHDRGIGQALFHRSIEIAKELGMRSIWGLVSSENAKVLAMAEKLGFVVKRDPEEGLVELEISLDPD